MLNPISTLNWQHCAITIELELIQSLAPSNIQPKATRSSLYLGPWCPTPAPLAMTPPRPTRALLARKPAATQLSISKSFRARTQDRVPETDLARRRGLPTNAVKRPLFHEGQYPHDRSPAGVLGKTGWRLGGVYGMGTDTKRRQPQSVSHTHQSW